MTTPEKGVEEVREEIEEQPTEDKKEPSFTDDDPRKDIYAKSDAIRFGVKPEQEDAGEEVTEETPSAVETADAEEVKEKAKVFTHEELIEHFGDVVIKGKIDGKEVEAPIGDWIKATGLESKLTRKAQELSAKEKELSVRERELVDEFNAVKEPSPELAKVATKEAAERTPHRYLTETQVQEQYDQLVLESPYRAQKFLDEVKDAKFLAEQESARERVSTALKDFRKSYPDVSEADWLKMNDEAFIEKYPDIVQARYRAMRSGDHYATFVIALVRLAEEKLSSEKDAVLKKESAKEAELKKRTEAKKKGQVLRMQTKQEPIIPKKDEGPKDPAEERKAWIRQLAEERRASMGLGPPRK